MEYTIFNRNRVLILVLMEDTLGVPCVVATTDSNELS